MPWVPVVETKKYGDARAGHRDNDGEEGKNIWRRAADVEWEVPVILAYRPSCACGLAEREPPVVLDPFVGVGTSCVVAQQLGRRSIGIDLSEAYLKLAVKRLEGIPLSLKEEA